MNILLVYPRVEETFWSFKHALKIVRRKAAFPPLGALTVAAMLPASWNKRLVDLNARELTNQDLAWADYVFISAMLAQKKSARKVINRCHELGLKTVGGGPLFGGFLDEFSDLDHIVCGEAENAIGSFVADLEKGTARHVYRSTEHPCLEGSPIPLWGLIDLNDYSSMSVQYSRGCPFNCEFCDIIVMNGRIPRTKTIEQVLAELDALYDRNWRGPVFIVDDNFIGNKQKVKQLLRKVIAWQQAHGMPFSFFTEASVDLAEDVELMELMVSAGFNKVFLGLETPAKSSLKECGKAQNLKRGLAESVCLIQHHGLVVMGGFIIGFDSDPPDIFQRQVDFIQGTGVVAAMIGLLTALPGTRPYNRLEREGRLLFKASGDNTDISGSLNFIPKMDRHRIINGYRWVMSTIYSPEMFHRRLQAFLRHYQPRVRTCVVEKDFLVFLRSLWYLGIADQKGSRGYYLKLLRDAAAHYRQGLVDVVTMAIYGYHFRRLFWSPKIPIKWEEFLTRVGLQQEADPSLV